MGVIMLEVRKACTKKDRKTFIRLPWKIYKGDKNWVPPLLMEMKHVLDRESHPFFEIGEAEFFLVFRDGECVGRITAHINHKHNEYNNVKDGFFGFYECTNDTEASTALLKAAEDWVKAKGMTRIVGPENYTIYDEIGFMADGWDAEPSTPIILQVYTPEYYLDLMADAGYQKEIDWYAFMMTRDMTIKPFFKKIKQRLERQGFIFRNINMKNYKEEVTNVERIVNNAWSENWGHVPYTKKQFEAIAKAVKMIIDPRMVFFVEKDGKVVGCAINLPDINPSVKKMNGRLFPFGWWHLLRGKKKAFGLRTFLFGVLKDYRNKGIDIALVMDTFQQAMKIGYEWSDCSIIVETNRRMIDPLEKWGGKLYKTYRLFNKTL